MRTFPQPRDSFFPEDGPISINTTRVSHQTFLLGLHTNFHYISRLRKRHRHTTCSYASTYAQLNMRGTAFVTQTFEYGFEVKLEIMVYTILIEVERLSKNKCFY